ncbi:hypothetical protein M8C21_009444 [Ambrosia artemisiifolia]|uniref:GDSL esterase/lipase n=1 Tax=Ambrosia artemisiifolia TaxID=4212 RepID=A0AAD5G636_AMBAR|nr:hypothetical protein M8C21_009444 [Ambrosia artemisiifolia]
MDNGNNNQLLTQAKVNFPPYGIDFPDGPTGRFSNGRNTADVIAQLLGFNNFIPPFATAKGMDIVNGVNYASGSAGILDETAEHLDLYKSGARMFGIFAAGYSGCTPGIMTEFGVNSCVDEVNSAVILFNSRLNTTLNDLNNKLVDAKFIFLDGSFEYPSDLNVTDTPCCAVSSTSGKGQCAPNQVPCSNRQNYYFWDAFHPTERVNVLTGTKAYETLSSFYTSETIAMYKDKETGYISVA